MTGTAFNNLNPPKDITNPGGEPSGAEFPKHLYKFAAEEGEGVIVVAWDGKKPVYNAIVDAVDPKDQAAKLKDDYSLKPVLKAPK